MTRALPVKVIPFLCVKGNTCTMYFGVLTFFPAFALFFNVERGNWKSGYLRSEGSVRNLNTKNVRLADIRKQIVSSVW